MRQYCKYIILQLHITITITITYNS